MLSISIWARSGLRIHVCRINFVTHASSVHATSFATLTYYFVGWFMMKAAGGFSPLCCRLTAPGHNIHALHLHPGIPGSLEVSHSGFVLKYFSAFKPFGDHCWKHSGTDNRKAGDILSGTFKLAVNLHLTGLVREWSRTNKELSNHA